MEHHLHPDTSPVYQETADDASAESLHVLVRELPTAPPRQFALSALDADEESALGGFKPIDAVGWGMEFANEAVVYLRDPDSGRQVHGVFGSAERACDFYSRFGALRLVYV